MTPEQIREAAEKIAFARYKSLGERIDAIESICLQVRREALEEAAKIVFDPEIDSHLDDDGLCKAISEDIRDLIEDKK